MARAAADKDKVNENYVKTKIDSMCGCPKKEKFTFYVKEQDETIGKFLFKMSKQFSMQCDQCKEPMYKHFVQFYHKDGCLELHIDALTQSQIQGSTGKQAIEKKHRDIIMRGFCQVCQTQVTPDTVMTNSFYEYSKARFFEQFFYNGDRLLNLGDKCNHKSLKDISRIFIMPGNYQIKFTFIPLEVYQIEMIQPKKQDTAAVYKQAIEAKQVKMVELNNQAYEDLLMKMDVLVNFIKSEKRSYLPKEQQKKLEQSNNTGVVNVFLNMLSFIKNKLTLRSSEAKKGAESKPSVPTFESELTQMKNDF